MPIESNTSTPELTRKPTFDSRLEGLRGLAALTVVLGHTVVIKYALDPHYQPTGIFSFQAPGHLSVLVFFILSGYVIGISTKNALTKETIGLYLKKRFVRIWPIYIISLILAVLLSPPLPVANIVSSLFFLQILWKPVISANAPLWSLHYEMLFYLLFIPVSAFSIRSIYVCVGSFVAGLGFLFFSNWSGAPLLTSYLFGFSLWSLGLVLVDLSRHNAVHYSNSQLISAFLLFFSLEKTNQLQTVFTKIYQLVPAIRWTYDDSIDWPKRAIALVDFSYLPYCILMMVIFTNRSFPLRKFIIALLYAIPAYALVYVYHNRTNHTLVQEYAIPVCSYLISLLLLVISRAQITEMISGKLLDWSIKLGALSYGLYVIHYPILMLFRRVDYFSGTWATFATRFLLFMTLSIISAYILEKKLQRQIRNFFFPR
jgi:peptidoglycan/LPS O-acetylase OafA/YrhL